MGIAPRLQQQLYIWYSQCGVRATTNATTTGVEEEDFEDDRAATPVRPRRRAATPAEDIPVTLAASNGQSWLDGVRRTSDGDSGRTPEEARRRSDILPEMQVVSLEQLLALHLRQPCQGQRRCSWTRMLATGAS